MMHLSGGSPQPSFMINASLAVQCFFVISGFTIAQILKRDLTSDFSYKYFFFRRYFRILPMHLIVLFFIFLMGLWPNWWEHTDGFSFLAYIQNFTLFGADFSIFFPFENGQFSLSLTKIESPYLLVNQPAWSLGAEILFYLMAPFLIRRQPSTVFLLLLGVLAFEYFSLIAFQAQGAHDTYLRYGFYFFPLQLKFFLLGALSSYLTQSRQVTPNETSTFSSFVSTILVIFALCFLDDDLQNMIPWALAFFLPFLFQGFKNRGFDKWAADASFIFYLLHMPFARIAEYFTFQIHGLSPAASLSLVCLSVSGALVFLVDRPIRKWINFALDGHFKIRP